MVTWVNFDFNFSYFYESVRHPFFPENILLYIDSFKYRINTQVYYYKT